MEDFYVFCGFFRKLIYDFYLSKTTVQKCNLAGLSVAASRQLAPEVIVVMFVSTLDALRRGWDLWRFAALIPSGCRLPPIHKVMGDHASEVPPPPGFSCHVVHLP